MTSNGNSTLAYLLSDTREIMHHCNFNAGWPLNAEIARGCLSVVLIYKLATLVVRNPREASCACLPRDLLLQALPIKFHLISQRPQAKAVTLRGEVGAPSEN